MKVFPSLMVNKIERDNPFEYEGDPHPSVQKNKENKEFMEKKLIQLHNSAKNLKAGNREAWAIYQEALLSLYENAKEFQRSGFFHLIAQGTDPQYFTYTKIYAMAQIEVLESILSISLVEPAQEEKKTAPEESKKKSNKIVDFFLKYVSRYR